MKTTDYHEFTTKDMPQKIRRKLNVGDIWINEATCDGCGETIRSKNRHDMVYCKCGETFIDGGSWYSRVGGKAKTNIVMFDNIEEDML